MRIEKRGYEYRGFKLGQKIKFKGNLCTIIAFHLDESDKVFIAINKKYHSCIRDSSIIHRMVVLEGHEYSEYMWISKERIDIIEDKQEEEKETVLEIEYIKVFDEKYVVRISKQNYEVFTRGKFRDNELGIISNRCFAYGGGTLYLNGDRNMADDRLIYLDKVNLDKLIELVEKINNKYGIPKTTPEEDYGKLEKLEFKPGEENYFVYYSEEDKFYFIDCSCIYNMSSCGMKYISREDANKFCDKWNKKIKVD